MHTTNTLVVCYSHMGNTRTLAGDIARALHCPVESLRDMAPRLGFFSYFKCGFDAWFERLTPLEPTTHDPSRYDLVIVATPVWNHSLPPAMRTYLDAHKGEFKNIAFVCTENASGAGRVFQQMTKACSRAPVAVLAVRHDDVTPRSMSNIADFIDEISRAPIAA